MPTVSVPPPSKKDKGVYITHINPYQAREAGKRYTVTLVRGPADLTVLSEGVLLRMTGKPPNFQWRRSRIMKETGLTDYKLRGVLRELREKGFVRTTVNQVNGSCRGHLWEVTQEAFQWTGQVPHNQPSHRDVENRHVGGQHRNICTEEYNHSLTLSESGEGNQLSFTGPTEELPEAASTTANPEPPDIMINCDTPGESTFVPVGAFNPELLNPPCNWGTNPDKVFNWVKANHYARLFKQILGPGVQWDRESARAFSRRFQRGAIRPMEIYVMARVGRMVMREAIPGCDKSLKDLAKAWPKLVVKLGAEVNGPWRTYQAEFVSQNWVVISSPPDLALWALQAHADDKDLMSDEFSDRTLEAKLLDLTSMMDQAEEAWLTRQLTAMEAFEGGSRFWATMPAVCLYNLMDMRSFVSAAGRTRIQEKLVETAARWWAAADGHEEQASTVLDLLFHIEY